MTEPREQPEGVDVSRYQGPLIDWPAVAASGISWAYDKIGQGLAWTDERFLANWIAARAAGLEHGPYFFLSHDEDPAQQAKLCLTLLAEVYTRDALPLVVDVETAWRSERSADALRVFLAVVRPALGYDPGIYSYAAFLPLLSGVSGWRWVASYSAHEPRMPPGETWTAWQYSGHGRVPGIAGDVDRSRLRGTVAELRALAAPT